jgi:hypothetical protein
MNLTVFKSTIIALAIVTVYPFVFGLLLLTTTTHKSPFLTPQSLLIYITILAMLRTAFISRRNVRIKSEAPFSYIKLFIAGLPLMFFVVTGSILAGFGFRWAIISL